MLTKETQYSKVIAIGAGIITIWLVLPYIIEFIRYIKIISTSVSGLDNCFKIIIKIIGISFLCEFASQLCVDSGEGYLASKINFAGKIMIICIASPDFISLLNVVIELIEKI